MNRRMKIILPLILIYALFLIFPRNIILNNSTVRYHSYNVQYIYTEWKLFNSWWTKRGLGRFFTGFRPCSRTTNFIPPFTESSHSFHFISSAPVMVRQAWSASTLATHGPILWGFIASHPSTRSCVGHELRIFIYL